MRFALACVLALSIVLPAAAKANAWQVATTTDKMSGQVTRYMGNYSKNTLQGWLRSGKLFLGYTCGGGIYMRANDIGFHVDSFRNYCREQHARVKFDNESPEHITFCIWQDNGDGMTFKNESYSSLSQNKLIQKMKTAKTILMEVKLLNTKGRRQIAEFDLDGFTAAFNRCKQ